MLLIEILITHIYHIYSQLAEASLYIDWIFEWKNIVVHDHCVSNSEKMNKHKTQSQIVFLVGSINLFFSFESFHFPKISQPSPCLRNFYGNTSAAHRNAGAAFRFQLLACCCNVPSPTLASPSSSSAAVPLAGLVSFFMWLQLRNGAAQLIPDRRFSTLRPSLFKLVRIRIVLVSYNLSIAYSKCVTRF